MTPLRVERPALEVADIFRRHGAAYRTRHRLPLEQHRLMRAIEVCRTAALWRACGALRPLPLSTHQL
jgi:hypothetical protein